MQRWLLTLYPKDWLRQYGNEYAALLEDMGLSFATVIDVVKGACLIQLGVHKRGLITVAGTAFSFASSVVCMRLNLTSNVWLWAPTNPDRALGLFITLGSLLYATYCWLQPFHAALRTRKWHVQAIAYLLLILPTGLLSLLFLTLFYSFFGVGFYGLGQPTHVLLEQLPLLALSISAIKVLAALRGRGLRRILA